jgi:hypothetical protein
MVGLMAMAAAPPLTTVSGSGGWHYLASSSHQHQPPAPATKLSALARSLVQGIDSIEGSFERDPRERALE